MTLQVWAVELILLRSEVPLDPTGSIAGAMNGTSVLHGMSEHGAE